MAKILGKTHKLKVLDADTHSVSLTWEYKRTNLKVYRIAYSHEGGSVRSSPRCCGAQPKPPIW